jgi:hypothetical protein
MNTLIAPVRIQLSRAAGFNLQRHSLALNGLPAAKIDRTTNFGNPYVIGATVDATMVRRWGWNLSPHGRKTICSCAKDAVDRFEHALLWDVAIHDHVRKELGGKNLACWCTEAEPCHGGPLLFVANSKPAEIAAMHAATDKAIIDSAAEIMKRSQH